MEGMEDPEYYSSDFFVRTLGSEDIDVKHFMYLVGRVSIYCDGTDNITGESCIPQRLNDEFIALAHKLHYRAVIKYKEEIIGSLTCFLIKHSGEKQLCLAIMDKETVFNLKGMLSKYICRNIVLFIHSAF